MSHCPCLQEGQFPNTFLDTLSEVLASLGHGSVPLDVLTFSSSICLQLASTQKGKGKKAVH